MLLALTSGALDFVERTKCDVPTNVYGGGGGGMRVWVKSLGVNGPGKGRILEEANAKHTTPLALTRWP